MHANLNLLHKNRHKCQIAQALKTKYSEPYSKYCKYGLWKV